MPEEPVGLLVAQPAGVAANGRERKHIARTFMTARPGTAAVVFATVPLLLLADSVAAYYGFHPGPARKAMMVLAGAAALVLAIEICAAALWLGGIAFRRLDRSWHARREARPAPTRRLLRPIRLALLALLVAFIIRPPSAPVIKLRSVSRRHRLRRWRLEVGELDFGQN